MATLGGAPPKPPNKPGEKVVGPKVPAGTPTPPAAPQQPARPPGRVTLPARDLLQRLDGNRRQRERRSEALPRDRLGDEALDAQELSELSVLLAAEHLMILLAKGRGKKSREALIAEVGDRLLAHQRPDMVKKILLAMAEMRRVVDVYPLEVLIYVLDRRPWALPGVRHGILVKNKAQIEARRFAVEEVIRLEMPLSAKLKAMALEGGGTPGYHLYPGHPAEYLLELGDAGRFTILLRAEIHGESVVDRVTVQVEDG